jgi:hypothetical protein
LVPNKAIVLVLPKDEIVQETIGDESAQEPRGHVGLLAVRAVSEVTRDDEGGCRCSWQLKSFESSKILRFFFSFIYFFEN